jgi:hypothetical protein
MGIPLFICFRGVPDTHARFSSPWRKVDPSFLFSSSVHSLLPLYLSVFVCSQGPDPPRSDYCPFPSLVSLLDFSLFKVYRAIVPFNNIDREGDISGITLSDLSIELYTMSTAVASAAPLSSPHPRNPSPRNLPALAPPNISNQSPRMSTSPKDGSKGSPTEKRGPTSP